MGLFDDIGAEPAEAGSKQESLVMVVKGRDLTSGQPHFYGLDMRPGPTYLQPASVSLGPTSNAKRPEIHGSLSREGSNQYVPDDAVIKVRDVAETSPGHYVGKWLDTVYRPSQNKAVTPLVVLGSIKPAFYLPPLDQNDRGKSVFPSDPTEFVQYLKAIVAPDQAGLPSRKVLFQPIVQFIFPESAHAHSTESDFSRAAREWSGHVNQTEGASPTMHMRLIRDGTVINAFRLRYNRDTDSFSLPKNEMRVKGAEGGVLRSVLQGTPIPGVTIESLPGYTMVMSATTASSLGKNLLTSHQRNSPFLNRFLEHNVAVTDDSLMDMRFYPAVSAMGPGSMGGRLKVYSFETAARHKDQYLSLRTLPSVFSSNGPELAELLPLGRWNSCIDKHPHLVSSPEIANNAEASELDFANELTDEMIAAAFDDAHFDEGVHPDSHHDHLLDEQKESGMQQDQNSEPFLEYPDLTFDR